MRSTAVPEFWGLDGRLTGHRTMPRRVDPLAVKVWHRRIAPLPPTGGWPSAGRAQGEGAAPSVPVVAASDLPRDLSPWGMFLTADPLVKAVLIGLAVASLVTWTVWLAKSIE